MKFEFEHKSLQEIRDSIPTWMLSRRILFDGAVASALVVAACVSYGFVLSAESDLHTTETHVEMQKLLVPALSNLQQQIANAREAVYYADTGAWKTVPELLDRLRSLSFLAGMRNAEFIPDPRSAAQGGLRISVFAEGSTESIRQFVSLLSGQSWCSSVEMPIIRTTGQWREFSATVEVIDSSKSSNTSRGGRR